MYIDISLKVLQNGVARRKQNHFQLLSSMLWNIVDGESCL